MFLPACLFRLPESAVLDGATWLAGFDAEPKEIIQDYFNPSHHELQMPIIGSSPKRH
jgi:hypothetical protein